MKRGQSRFNSTAVRVAGVIVDSSESEQAFGELGKIFGVSVKHRSEISL